MICIERIVISAKEPGGRLAADRLVKHPAQGGAIDSACVDRVTDNATSILIRCEQNPVESERCRFAAKSIDTPEAVLHMAKKSEPGRSVSVRQMLDQ